ncbi:hypothetical protein TNCT_509981 [Trichonephila clavata]|uniref:Uncharacterized protein n=1 Tax=Trichonephila clavata TaxID=2740835 RepID=A0A8X6FLN9_TRICU|nr:hypothetical protein TNCT_509981 [Trichonephila clavata]
MCEADDKLLRKTKSRRKQSVKFLKWTNGVALKIKQILFTARPRLCGSYEVGIYLTICFSLMISIRISKEVESPAEECHES